MQTVEFPVAGDGRVFVETAGGSSEESADGLARAGAGERLAKAAAETWEQALSGMRSAAEGALQQLSGIEPAPDEVEVNFKVAVNGKLGATLVTAGTDAHFDVKVVWKKPNKGGD